MSVPSNLVPTFITALPLAATLQPNDTIVVVQGGITKQAALAGALNVAYVPSTREINTSAPLAGGGDLTANRTLTLNASASSVLLGRRDASSGAFEEITLGTGLTMTGTVLSSPDAGGTVTSVNASGGTTGLSFTGGPITTSGTLTLTGTLGLASGGTNANLSATGGTSQVLKQTTVGGAITVGQLAAADLSNGSTGSGAVVLANTPTLITPVLGVATATTINKVDLTAPATGATLTLADNSTLATVGAFAATLTFTAPTNVTFPTSGTLSTTTGTVTSIDVSGGTTGLTFSGGPITSAGTITMAGTLDVDNGGTGQTSYTDGQLLIGNSSGNTLTKATLTQGANITITNGNGTISIAATGSTAGITWNSISANPSPAVNRNGYLCDTTVAPFTVDLPATPSIGNYVAIADALGTFDTNSLTVGRNGSNIMGSAADMTVSTEWASFTLVYQGASQGWVLT